ncbi:FRG domain-containing protein [Antarcticirhabdus aurantiaca]|uniref:FRG domain-containing protein n=1 Tax=Antarcticirhabdus aurantiaca TaxID=2606717 RepID=A0ACD4NN66_9HYPH|nr:FRG domain-containing protein [Antarcticirhabdus aurantiaca]WAJ28335.1 FRG domain-containing protein [Jeongeuplla avenae]
MPIVSHTFPSFSAFLSQFVTILFPSDGVFVRERFLFRGQGNSNYKLVSSFDRRFAHLPIIKRVERYNAFVGLLLEEMREIDPSCSETDALGLAQHHGVPTRLLDWSSSPLIAAYFAFHELATKAAANHVSIWCLDTQDTDVWSKRLGVELLSLKTKHNDRATRQLGSATNLSSTDESIEDFVVRLNPGRAVLYKFNVSASDSRAAFAWLDACNIRATELFGSIDGRVQTALERLYLQHGA